MDCCAMCASDEWQAKGCVYWTYTPEYGNRSCWLKTARSGVRSLEGAISGMVNVSAPRSAGLRFSKMFNNGLLYPRVIVAFSPGREGMFVH